MKRIIWLIITLVSIRWMTYADTNINNTVSNWAQEQWIIADTGSLDNTLTRAQAAQLYLNIAKSQRSTGKIIELNSQSIGTWCIFDDIADHPYSRSITTACQRWIMKWVTTSFQPDLSLTSLHSFVILSKIYWRQQDESQTPRYSNYINRWLTNQLITADQVESIINNPTIDTNSILNRAYQTSNPTDISRITKIKWLFNTTTPINTTSGDAQNSWNMEIWDTSMTNKWDRLTWIWWLLLIILVRTLIKFLRWWFTRSNTTPVPTWVKPTWIHDDLTLVEGVGPKVQQILYDHDIFTYETLARMTPWHISNILAPYGSAYEYMNPITRPRQAALARDGRREDLETLKKELFRWT